jgi:hypothetical protein
VEESESRSFFSVEPMFCDDDAGDDADCSLSSQLLFLSLVVSLFFVVERRQPVEMKPSLRKWGATEQTTGR